MNQTALSLFVGLIAGLAGGYVGHLVSGESEAPIAPLSDTGDGSLAAWLDRIESLLREQEPPMTLDGNLPPPNVGGARTVKVEIDDAILDRLDERIRAAVKTSVEENLGSWDESEMVISDEPEKKKVTLAQAAAELQLSADEEEAVRRIHEESMEKVMKLLVDEGESPEDLKREFELAKEDPAKQGALMGRLMTKALTNLGGFMAVGLEHDQKMRNAIGDEKADRLDEEFDITDLDPYGIESAFEGMGR